MLPWNVYPLFPPGTSPFVMLLVMLSVMPKNLEFSLHACSLPPRSPHATRQHGCKKGRTNKIFTAVKILLVSQ